MGLQIIQDILDVKPKKDERNFLVKFVWKAYENLTRDNGNLIKQSNTLMHLKYRER